MQIGTVVLFLSSLLVQDGTLPKPSGGPLIREQAALDVRHYDLTLRVTPESRSIEGELTMTALALEETSVVVLDLDPHLGVRSVTSSGAELEFEFDEGLIRAPLARAAVAGESVVVTVAYGGEPRVAPRPPWDGGFTWSTSKDGRPWISTTCQMYGADLWWPCKDHPSDKPETMDLHITVPEGLICASNGTLVSDAANPDGTHTFNWHLANPISNYNVALNIGPYEVLESSWKSIAGETVPVYFWVLPESLEQAEKVLPEFVAHMEFHESILGPYAFRNEKYGIVETPHLGMEHQTIIAYGNEFRGIDSGYDWLHHHESAHEWWANLVTCRDWKDMWIHEGFGTYMQSLYKERTGGKEGYLKEMASQRRGIGNKKAVAPREIQDSLQIYRGHDIYSKGSWILHSLRWVIGDEDFFESFRRFAYPSADLEKVTDGSQVRLVDTNDYLECVELYSGQELDWFFEVYLRQPHLPELTVVEEKGQLTLRWNAPDDLPFPMPIPVRIGDEIRRVEMEDGVGRVRLPTGREYEVDPEHWILKQAN